MIYKDFNGIKISTLGMGNMRLPAAKDPVPGHEIDWDGAQEILDYAMANGINYYDTAYVYYNGESERCVGHCMKKHDRKSFYLATKYYIDANPDYDAVFKEQLERLQTDYIDFYLIHCLLDENIDAYLNSGAIEYFLEQKKLGKIKYLGFSSHASLDTLRRFADHHQWDFGQLQINYYDWLFGETQEEYKILEERNIPIIVMEPVRGGRLADLTPELNQEMKALHPDYSVASWALRFTRKLPQVQLTLSGMSNMEQIIDNVKTFSDEETLSAADEEKLFEICRSFKNKLQVPCTACRYCCDGCPKKINIPAFLEVYNDYRISGTEALSALAEVSSEGKPSDCIACGKCTKHCPQGIEIPKALKNLAEEAEKKS